MTSSAWWTRLRPQAQGERNGFGQILRAAGVSVSRSSAIAPLRLHRLRHDENKHGTFERPGQALHSAFAPLSVGRCAISTARPRPGAIRSLARVMRDVTGNLPPCPNLPDYPASIVRNAPDGARELTMARWGCPRQCSFSKAGIPTRRDERAHVASPHWRAGSASIADASCRSRRFRRTRRWPTDRIRPSGSLSTRRGRSHSSRESGPAGRRLGRSRKANDERYLCVSDDGPNAIVKRFTPRRCRSSDDAEEIDHG